MDTTQFRKAYTDYRKVEASVLSAQSSQWTLHAERFANAIDLATIKRPVFRIPYALPAPVNTMETKKLYPKRVSNLMPLSSTFTVNPTASTERLFLDQWHQGLGLPTVQDDKAIENFKIVNKRQFVDNFQSVMESTRSEDRYKNEEATKIIALCRNFLAAIPSSKSKGPLLSISQEVYDKLVLVNAQLTRESMTAIYDIISQITNKKDTGKLDERIKKEVTVGVATQKTAQITKQNQQITARGGVKFPEEFTDDAKIENAIPTIPNQGAKVPTPNNPVIGNPGTNVALQPTVGVPKADANPAIDPNALGPDPAAIPPEPPIPPQPLVPITNEVHLQDVNMIDKNEVSVITLNDLNAMKANFMKASDLLENAYTASNNGANLRNVSATYAIADTALPRGLPNQSQTAYVQHLKTITDKIQQEQEMNLLIQKYMTEGLTDVQARAKVNEFIKKQRETKPTVDKAAAAILNNTENQAREVNANNTQLNVINTTSPLPITSIPTSPTNPIANTNTQQVDTAKPPDNPEIKDLDELIEGEKEEETKVDETGDTGTTTGTTGTTTETTSEQSKLYQPFSKQIDDLVVFYSTNSELSAKDFGVGVYKKLGATQEEIDNAEQNLKPEGVNNHSFAYIKPSKMKGTMKFLMSKGFFKLNIPKDLDATTFNFKADGINNEKFIKNVPDLTDFRGEVLKAIGLGKPIGSGKKRARSESAVKYAPGYKSKKQRKNERVGKRGYGMEEEMRKAAAQNLKDYPKLAEKNLKEGKGGSKGIKETSEDLANRGLEAAMRMYKAIQEGKDEEEDRQEFFRLQNEWLAYVSSLPVQDRKYVSDGDPDLVERTEKLRQQVEPY